MLLCDLCVSVVNRFETSCNGICHTSIAWRRGAWWRCRSCCISSCGARRKQLKFPALRFVQQRQKLNQHRLRLRHWLLLALRCAIIALLAFALARPTLRGSGAAGKEGKQIAAALVFDNSLRMQYEHENQTRLATGEGVGRVAVGAVAGRGPGDGRRSQRAGSGGRTSIGTRPSCASSGWS